MERIQIRLYVKAVSISDAPRANKLVAIKAIRCLTDAGLKEAKDMVEAVWFEGNEYGDAVINTTWEKLARYLLALQSDESYAPFAFGVIVLPAPEKVWF